MSFGDSRPPLDRTILVAGAVSLPAFAALAILVWVGDLELRPALFAGLGIVVAVILLVQRYVRSLQHLRRYIDDLVSNQSATATTSAPPAPLRRGSLVLRDIVSAVARLHRTERNRSDELARLAASRETLLDGVPSAIIAIDGQARVLRANLPARTLFGEKLSGRDFSSVVRNPTILSAVSGVLEGEAGRDVEFTLSDGTEREFTVSIQRLATPSPDGTAAVIAFNDVTAARRAERMRGDFVANASHELRTPLSTLVGFIETLRGPAREDLEVHDRFLSIMNDEAQRMTRLVEDLLSLSRIELNEHTPPTGTVDLNELAKSTVTLFELQAARQGIKLQVKSSPDAPPVTGDRDELAQLLQNLVDNAMKYGRAGTPVTIEIAWPVTAPAAFPDASPQGAVALTVTDQGEGIAREHLPRLTERFYRVEGQRARPVTGTGLGLAIVKHIVSRHRGALTIESELGRGSSFHAFLPVAKAKSAVGQEPLDQPRRKA